jgi:hypothetical protein
VAVTRDRRRWHGWLIALAVLLAVAGLIVGLRPVPGISEGESFQCGSPFHYDNSEGYNGSSGFGDCNRTRLVRLPIALGAIWLGVGIGGFVLWPRNANGNRKALRVLGRSSNAG